MASQRQTAKICNIAEIKENQWEENPGYEPSGVRVPRGLLSRVNILGTVVSKEGNSVVVDDGSAVITARSFEEPPCAEVGSLVMVIGRPREYNGDRYIVLEICRPIDKGWVGYRRRELALMSSEAGFEAPKVKSTVKEPETVDVEDDGPNPFELIVDTIRTLDSGAGADVSEVLKKVDNEKAEEFLKTLLEEGEIFELKPGMVKVLE